MNKIQKLSSDSLMQHVGHKVVIVTYGASINVSLECETCNEVIIDFDLHKPKGGVNP